MNELLHSSSLAGAHRFDLSSYNSLIMFRIIRNSIHSFGIASKPHVLFCLRLHKFSSTPTNVKEPISKSVNQESFSVGYLMDHFGFSKEKAVSASQKLSFKNSDKPDALVSFFKHQGFTQSQIQKLVSINSRVLACHPQKTLLPKLQFFRSKGISTTDLARIVVFNHNVLGMSLEGNIEPAFNFFRDFLGSDQCVIHMLKRNAKLFSSLEFSVKPKIEILSQAGVPRSNIAYLLRNRPDMFLTNSDKLKESVEEVLKMRMDPESCSYNLAILILTVTHRSTWNEKMEAYKRWGCSEDEVLTAFKILPWIMSLSVEKINGVMSFCVNEMGWLPSEVMRKYFVLTLSLNKRIVPRWSVYRELESKGLVKGKCKVRKLFTMKEDLFLEQYVIRYIDEVPSLLKLYLEKLEALK